MPVTLNHSNEMLDLNTFAVHAKMETNQWRHKIEIKYLLTDKTTSESVNKLCERIKGQLSSVLRRERTLTDCADENEHEYFLDQIEILIDDFDDLIDDPMPIGELEEAFNYQLGDLYNLGDLFMKLKGNKLQKFMWIG